MNDTVANNARFGHESNDAQVTAACVAVCSDADIMALPKGCDTMLNFQGSNPSDGQRQRIVIARDLLREPALLLLLDEITTGLDTTTRERAIYNVLRASPECIAVFSTHGKEVMSRVDEVILQTGRNLPPPVEVRPVDSCESVLLVASQTQP